MNEETARAVISTVVSPEASERIIRAGWMPQWPKNESEVAMQATILSSFGLTRVAGMEWSPQMYYLNDEGPLATAVFPPEVLDESLEVPPEVKAERNYAFWVSLWPYASAWAEINEVWFVTDAWVTAVEPGGVERREAMVITHVTPTSHRMTQVAYQVREGGFAMNVNDMDGTHFKWWDVGLDPDHEGISVSGQIAKLVEFAQRRRRDDEHDPAPAWCVLAQLADLGYQQVWHDRVFESISPAPAGTPWLDGLDDIRDILGE